MNTSAVTRPLEERAIADFLTSASAEASALILEGDPGIGKTTLWLTAIRGAEERGFRVLSAQGAEAESGLAYATLADLLDDVDAGAYSGLPPLQLLALDQVLLRAEAGARSTDMRAIAAGFLAVIEKLTEATPVLMALDDLQWLDPSSARVLGSAVRRLSGRVGVLGTLRADLGNSAAWLQLPRPERCSRVRVGPMGITALHAVVAQHLGHPFSRPAMTQIHEISGGNPFYAQELARALDSGLSTTSSALPDSLAELVRTRVGELSTDVHDILLAMACVATPTTQLVSRALGADPVHIVELLEQAETDGIVHINGHRLRFAHPLLATGVYNDAQPAKRRALHRCLADIVEEPELRARHLALAATTGSPEIVESLDRAAESARVRGATAAAAELLDLAVNLGGDTAERRIRLARCHFDAGDPDIARAMLTEIIAELPPGHMRAQAASQLGFVHLFDDSFVEAAGALKQALDEAGDDLALRTRLLITLAYGQYNSGQYGSAARTIEEAVRHAEQLGQPRPLSRALRMRVLLHFLRGDGLNEEDLARALELDGDHATGPITFRPNVQNAMLMGWTGRLDEAHLELEAIRRSCIEGGEENELIFVASHSFLVEVWRGNFAEAALIAEDTAQRAVQLGGDVPLAVAMTLRATLAAYAGDERQARMDAAEAMAAGRRSGADLFVVWPISTLGFLEVSLRNYDAALATMEPLLTNFHSAPAATEIIVAWFIPHAVEALIAVDRLPDAEPMVSALQLNGQRLDRAWMIASGARCRAMLLAAQGDIDAATVWAEQAVTAHEAVPMPFDRGRTQLLLGELLQTRGDNTAAIPVLRDALRTFEDLSTPLWADRARTALAQSSPDPQKAVALSKAERRVAELAASGMTNREVAAVLFISPKTVEANLARAYRKLGLRSRAELGQRIRQADG